MHSGPAPRLGAGVALRIFPYLYCTADRPLRRNHFIAVALAPIVLVSLAAAVLIAARPGLAADWVLVAAVANAAGAIGDLWMVGSAFRHPPRVLIEDRETGFAVWSTASPAN